jgi:hypothetical protein
MKRPRRRGDEYCGRVRRNLLPLGRQCLLEQFYKITLFEAAGRVHTVMCQDRFQLLDTQRRRILERRDGCDATCGHFN